MKILFQYCILPKYLKNTVMFLNWNGIKFALVFPPKIPTMRLNQRVTIFAKGM